MPRKAMQHREVTTKDSSIDVPKVNRSASKWTKADLDCLGVDYKYRLFDDIRIGIEDVDMPVEFLESNYLFHDRLISSRREIC
jgi:hypothetical protein